MTPPIAAPAKTVMGYQAGEMIEQLKREQALRAERPKTPSVPPVVPAAEVPSYAATVAPTSPIPPPPLAPPTPPPVDNAPVADPTAATLAPANAPLATSGLVTTPTSANTVFITESPPPRAEMGGTGSVPVVLDPLPPGPVPPGPVPVGGGVPAVVAASPSQPVYVASTPRIAPPVQPRVLSATALPPDPFASSLRAVMIVFGVLLLGAFATPISLDPLGFNWDVLSSGDLKSMLPALLMAGIGFLSLVFGAIPLGTGVRGALAAVLGLAGVLTPQITRLLDTGAFNVTLVAAIIAVVLLIPSLLARSEYRDSILPRILVTLGVLGVLAPFLIPEGGGGIPIAESVTALTSGGAVSAMLPALFMLVTVGLCVLALLVWMPSPSSGAAKLWAWLFILRSMWTKLTTVIVTGAIADQVSKSPFESLASWVPHTAFAAILGYGLAAVIGKQLD